MNVASVGEHGEEAMARRVDSAMSQEIKRLAREATGGLSSCVSVIAQSQEGDCRATLAFTWRTKRGKERGGNELNSRNRAAA
jgi:L-aminopeptidase/D-esterase-like protein